MHQITFVFCFFKERYTITLQIGYTKLAKKSYLGEQFQRTISLCRKTIYFPQKTVKWKDWSALWTDSIYAFIYV